MWPGTDRTKPCVHHVGGDGPDGANDVSTLDGLILVRPSPTLRHLTTLVTAATRVARLVIAVANSANMPCGAASRLATGDADGCGGPGRGRMGEVLIVRATKKLLRLTGAPTAAEDDRGSTLLGPWYATVLFWRPRVALLVNETTLLPVLMPLAPAATLTGRIAEEVATVLGAHHVPAGFIEQERQHMQTCQLGTTANRSVVGVMIDFARLAQIHHDDDPGVDLADLAIQLARTPCGPLYRRHVSPDRELAATVHAIAT